MAIIIEQKREPFNWFGFFTVIFLLLVIFGGAYYLFFAPAPGIEIIAPLPLEQAGELSRIQFDPAAVVQSPQFKRLKVYSGLPGVGVLGRSDPFSPF